MQNNKLQQVEYNQAKPNCEYYIVAKKENFAIDKHSLSYLFEETERTIEIINNDLFSGNFDYMLVEENRIENKYTHIPCMENDIRII